MKKNDLQKTNYCLLPLVTKLIAQQFPEWAYLEIKPVESDGMDNRTFRLGEEMLIRLPSTENYALQVSKEQKWLKILGPHLSFSIPKPLAMGQSSEHYPWSWSIYKWIEGESANMLSFDDMHLNIIAFQLAQFLNELHKIDIENGPHAGLHNYWRGDHVAVYDIETRSAIMQLQDFIDARAITLIWEKAIISKWHKNPVWIHGDFARGNILIKDGQVAAIIDFGCMGIGDPACDLVIAWTFFESESREIFKSNLRFDQDTWIRAQGWALWKALITITSLKDKTCRKAIEQQRIIHEILNEYNF